ncbi:MAG TPA: N-6 DNA methylase [Pyrinomonadaceae bacterium]|nr:N-6 DNA methylase [Pyrinomonadaceae bacterium]
MGKTYTDGNAKLSKIIAKIAEGLGEFSTDADGLGDAYEYLLGQFAAGSGKTAGEFDTPQQISSILVRHCHNGQPRAFYRQKVATGKRA